MGRAIGSRGPANQRLDDETRLIGRGNPAVTDDARQERAFGFSRSGYDGARSSRASVLDELLQFIRQDS